MFNKDLIIELLEKKGWSQYKLSKKANMAQSTLSDILTGKNANPRMDTIQKIATALDVTVDSFFDNFTLSTEDANNLDEKCKPKKEDSETDFDLRRIERARSKMNLKDKEKMMRILEASFEDYFEDED